MSSVRPLRIDDVPTLIALHRKAFGRASVLGDAELAAHFREVFLDSPRLAGSESCSLVYEGEEGRVVGFIGVIPRRWRCYGAPCRAAVTSQLMVDPAAGAGMAAIHLLRRVFAGGFDLVLTDGATSLVRALWTKLGGDTLWTSSLEWSRPLRPGRHLLRGVAGRIGAVRRIEPFLKVLCTIPDAVAARVRPNRFHRPVAELTTHPVTAQQLMAERPAFEHGYRLVPDYTSEELTWLLRQAERHRRHGALQSALLRDAAGRVVGWYLYYVRPGAAAQVLQLVSRPGETEPVLRHLFRDAWRRGATAVRGRADAAYLEELGLLWCLLERRGPWVLAYAPRAEVRYALHAGTAWFTRLDAEYWLRFLGD